MFVIPQVLLVTDKGYRVWPRGKKEGDDFVSLETYMKEEADGLLLCPPLPDEKEILQISKHFITIKDYQSLAWQYFLPFLFFHLFFFKHCTLKSQNQKVNCTTMICICNKYISSQILKMACYTWYQQTVLTQTMQTP